VQLKSAAWRTATVPASRKPSNALPVVRLRAISGIFDQHYNGGTAFFSDALPASRYCALC